MILCLDVGNTHIYAGVFQDNNIKLRFRCTSKLSTSDETGIFLKSVLRENNLEPDDIKMIGACSVVPQLDYSIRSAIVKYFSIEPFFLQAGVKTGLNIRYKNPQDVGADRIANAIGAISLFQKNNLIIIDFGTATTFCAIDKNKNYLGGAIIPGVRLMHDGLITNTAKLSPVEIVKVNDVLGKSTAQSMQSGIFYGAMGACREIIGRMKAEIFKNEQVSVIATGGFANLFMEYNIFDHNLPDLVLYGIKEAMLLNHHD